VATITGDAFSTFDQRRVESVLANYYLRSDGIFGAGAVRYIDASEMQLRSALGLDNAIDPLPVLARACGGASAMSDALARDTLAFQGTADAPGFFRYLVMTCAIVATADNNDLTQEFGENLALAFDSHNFFTNRTALPVLWRRLRDWCNQQNAAGAPVRKVVLPPPGTGRYLGLTNAITFPGWRDLRRLRQLLDRRSEFRSIDGPVAAAKQLCPEIENDASFSPAMRQACEEYQKLYSAKASLLELHRFWLALNGLLQQNHLSTHRRSLTPRLELRFGSGLDDVELQVTLLDSKGSIDVRQVLDGCPDEVLRSVGPWLTQIVGESRSSPLTAAVHNGILPLVEAHFGVWHSSLRVPVPPVSCLILLSRKNKDLARKWGVEAEPIGEDWLLAGPVAARDAQSLYQYLGLGGEDSLPSISQALMLTGGFKTGSGFLGRASLLPKIEIAGPGTAVLTRTDINGPAYALRAEVSRIYSIDAKESLSGAYKIRLEEDIVPGIEPLAVEKSVVFFPDALEHVELAAIDQTLWHRAPETSTRKTVRTAIEFAPLAERRSEWSPDSSERFHDLLEAIYAEGRLGWSEQELVASIRRLLGADIPAVWDILRGLTECGWLMVTSNLRWRVRRWWIRPPSLVKLSLADGTEALLLTGSTPAMIRKRFTETAAAAGCVVEERAGPSEFAASMLLAKGADIPSVVDELQWSVVEEFTVPSSAAPDCWPLENVDESRHRRVARWDWKAGCFTSREQIQSDSVELERFRRERGDRDDLFVVSGPNGATRYATTSRTRAIAEAYRRAQVPLFQLDGANLVRMPRDGHLPDSLAAMALVLTCRSPGPALVDGRWTYVYPADTSWVQSVRGVMGRFFVGGRLESPKEGGHLSAETFGYLRNRNLFRVHGCGPAFVWTRSH
jgi:hypothetical protein